MAVKEVRDTVDIPENFEKLQGVIDEYKEKKGALIPVLQKAQDIFGYLPLEVQKFIAKGMDVPLQRIYGIATFYAQFSLEPKGEHSIGLCMGTACYVRGAQSVLEKLKEELGVDVGGTTEDLKFTLTATRCLGCCGLAPVMMIDDDVYGRLTPDRIPEILGKYR
ncbi:MAG TPA: NADH-quinone oxidoreductase subunit NuoE [Bacillota bacterium]|jgi:NADH:ubiquinone oxidoreductase subunit E|nr:NADH-quinone oxidoreductase subunit NuoE [Bacillota bacterium]HOC09173.1 NADH-quinone oxidoreductase subunit NuoE [Bacillota bacterium]HQD41278.1 NADH-quinone oxidoreductase subunit NuoE [Bacillota bacterium]